MTPDELRSQAARDYGTYVARVAIDIGNVRAFNVGDAVPVQHVEAGLVSADDVAKTSTKAGQALIENTEV